MYNVHFVLRGVFAFRRSCP